MKEVIKAAREFDKAALEATATNKVKKEKDQAKQQTKARLLMLMEHEETALGEGEEFHGVTLTIKGRQVTFSKKEDIYARITNMAAFRKWAEEDDSENWFEPEAPVREQLLNDHVRICVEEGRPLPPGVPVHVEPKISRTTR